MTETESPVPTGESRPAEQKPVEAPAKETKINNPFLGLLSRLVCHDITVGKKIYSLKKSDTMDLAVKMMGDHHIHCCPVLEDNKCIGLVDVIDALEYIDQHSPQDDRPDFTRKRHDDERAKASLEIRNCEVSQLINFSGQNQTHRFKENDSLDKVAMSLASGFQRVIVENDSGHLTGIISQSDLVRMLYQNIGNDEYKNIRDKTVESMGYTIRPIESVTEDQQLKDAIRALLKQGGGSLPVVDSGTGRLLANFSAFDLKSLFLEETPRFTQTILGFLRRYNPRVSDQPKVLAPNSNFGQALKMFCLAKLHNIWVVNPSDSPMGVVSLGDILRTTVSPRENWW